MILLILSIKFKPELHSEYYGIFVKIEPPPTTTVGAEEAGAGEEIKGTAEAGAGAEKGAAEASGAGAEAEADKRQ